MGVGDGDGGLFGVPRARRRGAPPGLLGGGHAGRTSRSSKFGWLKGRVRYSSPREAHNVPAWSFPGSETRRCQDVRRGGPLRFGPIYTWSHQAERVGIDSEVIAALAGVPQRPHDVR